MHSPTIFESVPARLRPLLVLLQRLIFMHPSDSGFNLQGLPLDSGRCRCSSAVEGGINSDPRTSLDLSVSHFRLCQKENPTTIRFGWLSLGCPSRPAGRSETPAWRDAFLKDAIAKHDASSDETITLCTKGKATRRYRDTEKT